MGDDQRAAERGHDLGRVQRDVEDAEVAPAVLGRGQDQRDQCLFDGEIGAEAHPADDGAGQLDGPGR
ncbi:hypothetical protein [Nonomuraea rosea]|uniref:hypothetical protein n=1 Tax=Nonomuraea rosea TaxID=638574 RepID=UPI0031E8E3D0